MANRRISKGELKQMIGEKMRNPTTRMQDFIALAKLLFRIEPPKEKPARCGNSIDDLVRKMESQRSPRTRPS